MKKNYIFKTLIIAIFFSSHFFAQVNVTLKVDMSGQTIDPEGVHAVGTINGWNTSATPLTKEEGTNIYSTSIELNTGWHEYKFINGNAWGKEESASYPCAPSNGNRFLYVNDSGNDVVLVAVPFNGCNDLGTSMSVTFSADMSGETVSGDGVKLAGWHNGWNGDNLKLPNVEGNLHSGTLRLPTPTDYPVVFEYKFVNGSTWETPGAACSTENDNNRIANITTPGQSFINLFNGCDSSLSTERFITGADVTYTKNEGLVLTGFENQSKLNVQVFNLLGQNVFSTSVINNNTKKTIQLNAIKTGVFIVKITDASQRYFTKKILNF